MIRHVGIVRGGVFACLFLLSAGASALAQEAAQPAPVVETTVVSLAPVTQQREFVGTVTAIQQVDIRARVEGFLDEVDFIEGTFVQSGKKLFEIEKDVYQATLDGAQATLASAVAAELGAQANLTQAQLNLTRQVELLKTAAVSQATVDQATATRDTADAQVKQAQAQIAQAQAQVKSAELNLSFTDVSTPIAGRIGKLQITEGNLVSPSSGPLATVVQMDPIRVAFSIADRDYLDVIRSLKPTNPAIAAEEAHFLPRLRLPDGSDYALAGKISFAGTSINQSTGTIPIYAEFANPDLELVPGQYVTVIVQSGQPRPLPTVPAAAVMQDQDGFYVFVLGDGNRATIRRVTLGQRVGTDWAVASGLAPGDVVITSGIQKVTPGAVVQPQAAAGN